MKHFSSKKKILFFLTIIFIIIIYTVFSSFIYSANLGYFVDNALENVAVPTDEEYIAMYTRTEIDWEIAYWSAMICEYTYEKPSYPINNLALSMLGFEAIRKYTFYELNDGLEDDLMVDVGVKEIRSTDGSDFKLVVISFRGSVPAALNDPTSKENMRRNMEYASKPWGTIEASVHEGFHDQYQDFLTDILSEVNAEFDLNILQPETIINENIRFWITGHSMGGALAELFTLDLIENGVEPSGVMTYGFATPLVGDNRLREYSESIGTSDRIHKIVHRQDMVGYIGYGLFWGKSLASDSNTVKFGRKGVFDRSHHSLPRIYLPYIISQNDQSKQKDMEESLVVVDM